MMSNLCFSLVLFIAFSPISHPNLFLLLACFLSLSSSRHVFFMCLVLAFVDTSNKGNSTLSWIQTSVTYTELKYYQILLLCSSKSFLFSTYVLVSPWRGRRWCRLWTHKFRKQKKKWRRNHTSLRRLDRNSFIPYSSLIWNMSLVSDMSAR